jgi:hypothetical protein
MTKISLPIRPYGKAVIGLSIVGLILMGVPLLSTWSAPPVSLSVIQSGVDTEIARQVSIGTERNLRADKEERADGQVSYRRRPYLTDLDILRASGSTISFKASFHGTSPDEVVSATGDMQLESFIDYGRTAMLMARRSVVMDRLDGRRTVHGEIENLSLRSNLSGGQSRGLRPGLYESDVQEAISVAFKSSVFPEPEYAYRGDVFVDMTFTDEGLVIRRVSIPLYVRITMLALGIGALAGAGWLHARSRWGGEGRSFGLNVSFGYGPRAA